MKETPKAEIPRRLTAVLSDVGPFVMAQEPVRHRRVTVDLTEEQIRALTPRWIYTHCGNDGFEEASLVFFEYDDERGGKERER